MSLKVGAPLKIKPPPVPPAELPETVLLVIVNVPLEVLKMPPPETEAAEAELLETVLLVIVSGPALL